MKKRKKLGKKRSAFILIKNLQLKKQENRKTIAQKLPTLGPVFWAQNTSLCALKKQWKIINKVQHASKIYPPQKKQSYFLDRQQRSIARGQKSFSSHFAFLYKRLTKNILKLSRVHTYFFHRSVPPPPKARWYRPNFLKVDLCLFMKNRSGNFEISSWTWQLAVLARSFKISLMSCQKNI